LGFDLVKQRFGFLQPQEVTMLPTQSLFARPGIDLKEFIYLRHNTDSCLILRIEFDGLEELSSGMGGS
jgi:hypothetical protein